MLNSQHEISPRNLDALIHAQKIGVEIIIASGRMTPSILPVIKGFTAANTLIAYNGAKLLEKKQGAWQVIFSASLPPTAVEEAIALSGKRQWLLNIYHGDKLFGYHSAGDYQWADFYTNATGSVYHIKTRRSDQLPLADVTKLLIVTASEKRNSVFRELEEGFKPTCKIIKSQPEYTEMIPANVSKAEALSQWCQMNSIKPAQIVAMGDAENDLELLEFAGTGIAAANATPGLKAAFQRISQWTNDEDMVAKELAAFLDDE